MIVSVMDIGFSLTSERLDSFIISRESGLKTGEIGGWFSGKLIWFEMGFFVIKTGFKSFISLVSLLFALTDSVWVISSFLFCIKI